jgi:SAM-dependent methyltransferase
MSGTGDIYDAEHISRHFDAYGEREWDRLVKSPRDRVSLHIHNHYLRQYIRSGDAVLEAGAGPGRFTLQLAALDARVTVGDISPVQLELHREKMREAGCEEAVVARHVLDIVDLSRFPTASFDAVVCYGGPLSYVFDHAGEALEEMLRITKPGGHVLLGVMSLLGSTQQFLGGVLAIAREQGIATVQAVNDTGDLRGAVALGGHHCHMYRWAELETLLRRPSCTLVATSASNCLSMCNDEVLAGIEADSDLWRAFLRWELDFCAEPGALDGGTHILAVARRT